MTPNVRNSEIQVLIVGAGLGGLSLAICLQQAGLEPVVIERAETLDEPDGAIELWPDTLQLFDYIGMGGAIRDIGTRVTQWSLRQPNGTEVLQLNADTEPGFVAVRYAQVRERLADNITNGILRTDTALRSFTGGDIVTVEFANGVYEEFDIIIGADGVHSWTRALLDGSEPTAYDTTSWAFALENEVPVDGAIELWTSDGAVLRILPTGDHSMGWLTLPTDTSDKLLSNSTPLAEQLPEIEGLSPETLNTKIRDGWAVSDFHILTDVWHRKRVALLGDAAHAQHRLSGIGPRHALQDAILLTSKLTERDDQLSARLTDYATRRRLQVNRVFQSVDHAEILSQIDSPLLNRYPTVASLRSAQLQASFQQTTNEDRIDSVMHQS